MACKLRRESGATGGRQLRSARVGRDMERRRRGIEDRSLVSEVHFLLVLLLVLLIAECVVVGCSCGRGRRFWFNSISSSSSDWQRLLRRSKAYSLNVRF